MHVHNDEQIDHDFVQINVCELPRLTAAKPSKQSKVHVDTGKQCKSMNIEEADDDHGHVRFWR